MQHTPTATRNATAAVSLNYLVWGLLPLFWALLGEVNSLYILAQRIMWSTLLAGAWLLIASRRRSNTAHTVRGAFPALLMSALAIAVNWGLYIWAVSNGYVSYAALAYFVSPLLSILLGAVVFREKLEPAKWLAICLAGAGALAYGWGQSGMGLAVVFGVAGSFAIYAAIKKTVTVAAVKGLFVESAVLSPIAFGLIVAEILTPGTTLTLTTWGLFILAGAVTFLPLLVMSHFARIVPFTLLGMLQYISPVVQLVLSVTVFRESIESRQLVALALILTGVAIFVSSSVRAGPQRI
ncbi:EamA family transporter RarD [Corynebacterium mayonis]|uniref:EamA family transporter RarD n=1 Tax=Corynebacterium mayonis TaxID=3062461 RepID=UPI00314013E0